MENNNIEWLQCLPEHPKLEEKEVFLLENFRKNYNVSNKNFGLAVLGSEEFSLRVQKYSYDINKEKYPNKSEFEILKIILSSRYFEESDEIIDGIMKSINTFEDLCEYVKKRDQQESFQHKSMALDHLINSVIAGELDKNKNQK